MDGNTIPVNENTTIIVKSSGDLFLRGVEQGEVHFRGSEDRIRVHQSNDTLYVETRASLDLEVPRSAKVIVEKVGGTAFVQDLDGDLVVQKIGGDLSLQRIGGLRIEKVGGGCMIEGVSDALNVEKVGGDLTVRQAAGAINVESTGGDCDVQALGSGAIEARTGGDMRVYVTEGLDGNVTLRAGGDLFVYLPSQVNCRFNLNSGAEEIRINLSRQETPLVVEQESRRFEGATGGAEDGGSVVIEAYAGGYIEISDEAVEPKSITAELERLENAWMDARGRYGSSSWSAGFGFDRSSAWADMVSRRAQEAARRAEQRVQAASRRTEEQIRQAAEREMRRAERFSGNFPFGPGGGPMGPMEPMGPMHQHGPRSEPVTEKERLMVLQMLQEGKISVEQAEQLLAALEGRHG